MANAIDIVRRYNEQALHSDPNMGLACQALIAAPFDTKVDYPDGMGFEVSFLGHEPTIAVVEFNLLHGLITPIIKQNPVTLPTLDNFIGLRYKASLGRMKQGMVPRDAFIYGLRYDYSRTGYTPGMVLAFLNPDFFNSGSKYSFSL